MKYNLKKHYKETSESRRSHHRHLVRPDGTPISAQDCCMFDLLKQWTKNGKVATSTYEWLLKEKFPHKKDKKTVRRAFWNLSLYFKCKFEQKQVIDGKVHFHKLRIERVADFDIKTTVAEQKEIVRKCPQLKPKMVTAMTKNGHTLPPSIPEVTRDPSLPIKIRIKNTINDNHDYQHNQFLNSKNFRGTECVETGSIKVNNYKLGKVSVNGLAKKECKVTSQAKKQATEFVKTPETLKETKETTSYKQKPKTIETVGKDGNTYQSPYLRDFRFTERMIDTAISRSNKPHYTHARVWVIIRNILERKPDKTVYGGKSGAINYLVKAIDGERDYEYEYKYPPTNEERAISMAEIQRQNQLKLEAEIAKGGIEWT